jgi:hypothetical protein
VNKKTRSSYGTSQALHSVAAEGERDGGTVPTKAHALTIAMHHNVDRAGHIVFGIVETAAKAVRASLADDRGLRGLTGGSRAGGAKLVADAASLRWALPW